MAEGDAWDGAFKEAFKSESVLEQIERRTGTQSRILLRDPPREPTPVVRVPTGEEVVPEDARYRVLGEIARGGIGVIYKGHDHDLGRDVALKVLRADRAGWQDILDRFVEEAQVSGQLQHPGVVPVYSLGVSKDGRPFFAMKLVKGRTLSAMLEARKDPAADRRQYIRLFERVCQTVAYAHSRGVIHRDLKSANIMIGAFGEVQVMDWGLAKVMSRDEEAKRPAPEATIIATVRSGEEGSHSLAGSVMGTPAYMPPEQALGLIDQMDERCDVFSLGAILCEILTGQPPYVSEEEDLLVMAAQGRLDGARERLAACGADEEVIAMTKECLSPAAADRPRDAGHVARFLARYQADVEERARQEELAAAEAEAEHEEQHARLAEQKLRAEKERARVQKVRAGAKRERLRAMQERRAADATRRARQATVVIAALLVLGLLVSGFFVARKSREEWERIARFDALASAAVQEARELEGEQRWDEALAAASHAVSVANSAEPATRERAQSLQASIEAQKTAADRDRAQRKKEQAFLDRLATIRLQQFAEWYAGGADESYVTAFREFGIDVEALTIDETAQRIAATNCAVDLAATLDSWARFRRDYETLSAKDWRPLHEIAKRVDPDPWRNDLRAAAVAKDRERLLRLARTANVEQLDPRTVVLLGFSLLARGAFETAADLLWKAHEFHPTDVWISSTLVHALVRTRPQRKAEALRVLTTFVAAHKDLSPAWGHVGVFSHALGDPGRAEVALRHAIELDDRNWRIHSNLGNLLSSQRLWEEAFASYRRAAELRPGSVEIQILIARAHWNKGDREAALVLLRRLREKHPDFASPHYWTGYLLVADQRSAIAIPHLRRAAELAPQSAAAQRALSDAGFTAGHLRLAVRASKEALRIHRDRGDPDCLQCILWGAQALIANGDLDAAEKLARRAFGLDPESRVIHYVFAGLHMARGNAEKARVSLLRSVQLSRSPAVLNLFAEFLADNDGDLMAAIAHQRDAVRVAPNDHRWKCGLSDFLARTGEFNEALEVIHAAIADRPDSPICYEVLGRVYYLQGKYKDAAAAQEEARRRAPEFEPICVALGRTYLELGSFDDALKNLRRGAQRRGAREGMWIIRSAHESEDLERDLRLAEKLSRISVLAPGIIARQIVPGDAEECLAFGLFCYHTGRFARAVELFGRAFSENQTLAADPREGRRFKAACAAAVAGEPDKALEWLRADLKLWSTRRGGPMRKALWEWKRHHRLRSVRDDLGSLTESQRVAFKELWADVDALIAFAPRERSR